MTRLCAGLALVMLSAVAGQALAAGCGCSTPPSPPTGPPGHHTPPGVTVKVNATLLVNAAAAAQAQAGGSASATGGSGGGGFSAGPGAFGLIQNLNVEAGHVSRTAYEATRTVTKKVVIQALCIDDKDVPHPASQVTPDRDIEDSYDNELYRCIAGTRLQATIAEYDGQIDFGRGRTLACKKGDALYHSPGGHVDCRPQRPARDCNERSLLRRFGAGVKILTMITTETYTAYREETTQSVGAGSLTLDGGVGGMVY